jgi:hypothetical protein
MTNAATTAPITYAIDEYRTWCSGTRVSVILDPVARLVYTTAAVGGGCPEPVYHGRHRALFRVARETSAESLSDWLRGVESTIAAICDAYEGEHWTGSHHVGSWSDDAEGLIDVLEQEYEEAATYGGIATYWDASDYFQPAAAQVVVELAESASLDDAVQREIDAAAPDALLAEDDVREALISLAEREIEHHVESRDPHERLQRARLARLLRAEVSS